MQGYPLAGTCTAPPPRYRNSNPLHHCVIHHFSPVTLAAWDSFNQRPRGRLPDYSPQIYFDLFPTIVTFPDSPPSTPYTKTRFILAAPPTPYVYVFKDGFQGVEAAVFAEYDPDHIYGDTREGFDLILTAPNPTPIRHVHPPRRQLRLRFRPQGLPPVLQPEPHRRPHPRRPALRLPRRPRRALRHPRARRLGMNTPTLLTLIDALAVIRATRLITEDTITQPLRDRIFHTHPRRDDHPEARLHRHLPVLRLDLRRRRSSPQHTPNHSDPLRPTRLSLAIAAPTAILAENKKSSTGWS